jgi:SAM-dependent methyltransferase
VSGAAHRSASAGRRFRTAYAAHRATEGRGSGGDAELLALPYLERGPLARQWAVRARTFDAFRADVLDVRAREVAPRSVVVADLGAGNGWLCYRLAALGHRAVAVDFRTDTVDGLGAAAPYRRYLARMFDRVAADFETLPLADRTFDIAVFNAAVHYATELALVLRQAARVVVSGGRLAILDSPFYGSEQAGQAMVAEKRRNGGRTFGELADDLLSYEPIEYLTRERLADASRDLGLAWRRHRVRYPWWYELRPLTARLRAARPPARFDLWEATVP